MMVNESISMSATVVTAINKEIQKHYQKETVKEHQQAAPDDPELLHRQLSGIRVGGEAEAVYRQLEEAELPVSPGMPAAEWAGWAARGGPLVGEPQPNLAYGPPKLRWQSQDLRPRERSSQHDDVSDGNHNVYDKGGLP
eukprot:scaffold406801_cov30-Prasinocladus_malaysianus.AAC.3